MQYFFTHRRTATWNLNGVPLETYLLGRVHHWIRHEFSRDLTSAYPPYWAQRPEFTIPSPETLQRRVLVGRHVLAFAWGMCAVEQRPFITPFVLHNLMSAFTSGTTKALLARYWGYDGEDHVLSETGRLALEETEENAAMLVWNMLRPVVARVMDDIDSVIALKPHPLDWSTVKTRPTLPAALLEVPSNCSPRKAEFITFLRQVVSDSLEANHGNTAQTPLTEQFQWHPLSDFAHIMEMLGDLTCHFFISCFLVMTYPEIDAGYFPDMFQIMTCNATLGLLTHLLYIEDPMMNHEQSDLDYKRPGDVVETGFGMMGRTASGRFKLRLALHRTLPFITDGLLLIFKHGNNHTIDSRLHADEVEVESMVGMSSHHSDEVTDSDMDISAEGQESFSL